MVLFKLWLFSLCHIALRPWTVESVETKTCASASSLSLLFSQCCINVYQCNEIQDTCRCINFLRFKVVFFFHTVWGCAESSALCCLISWMSAEFSACWTQPEDTWGIVAHLAYWKCNNPTGISFVPWKVKSTHEIRIHAGCERLD